MTLIERLVAASGMWAQANDRSLSRLATIVVNDGKLFDRIAGGGSCTVATYERLINHLKDPTNWVQPMPHEAAALLGVGHGAAGCVTRGEHDGDDAGSHGVSSPGNIKSLSGQVSA